MKIDIRLKDFLKAPNLISLLRIVFLIPFMYFFYKEAFYETLTFIILIILTDFFDGFISRRFNLITELGKIIDPLADKIALGIGLFVIFQKADISLLIVYFLITRDVFIIVLGLILSNKNNSIPPSNIWGKLTSFFLSLLGLFGFIKCFYKYVYLDILLQVLWWTSLLFLILSSLFYTIRFLQMSKK